jgi:sortase (surface protein transpeptidase)
MIPGRNSNVGRFASLVAVAAVALTAAPAPTLAQPKTLPTSLPFADSAFETVWMRNDQLVAAKAIARSWTWGPAPGKAGYEAYTDSPDGSGRRLVQYFDKSRMEINNSRLDPADKWFVTNGLLTVELISGRLQLGNTRFDDRKPAQINIASDADDANAPTYASFGTVSNTSAGEKKQPDLLARGGYATGRINRKGEVTDDPSKARLAEAKIAYYDKSTGHNVPKVFWDFLNSRAQVKQGLSTASQPLLDPWVFAMGLPISDAYWANVKIAGKQQEVLVQAFERRVLTYAPEQPVGWQVQMGNIGQHYYEWRYGTEGPGPQKLTRTTPGMPMRLTIPALGVHTKVEQVGVDKDNNMDIPKDPANAAWFKPGTVPGNVGNAVMDGHLDWYGVKEAIFFHLEKLRPGDRVYVRDDKGVDRAFVITSNTSCIFNRCPLTDIFGPTTSTRLNLITCAGNFNRSTQNYDKRTVVYSELAPLP